MARIVVVGAGGVGGFFGGLLARHGQDVTFVVRGQTLDAIRANGLTVRSGIVGDFTVHPAATDDPASLAPPDLVLFCVKTYDLEEAAEQLEPAIGPETVVLPLQNGIDAPERLAAILGERSVLAGLTWVRATRVAPAVIEHAHSTQIVFGEPSGGRLTERVTALAELLGAAGIQAEAEADPLVPIWMKYAGICGAGMCALTRAPAGTVLGHPELREMTYDALKEVVAVGRARGVQLPENAADRLMSVFDSSPPSAKPSLLIDLEAGRRMETENLNGTVVRLGRELGAPTPIHRAIYVALIPYLNGAT